MKFQIYKVNEAVRLILLGFITLGLGTGCGYTLQNTHNSLAVKEGIRRIYVAPLINNTYKAGVENIVYGNLIRAILAHRQLILVRDPQEADAALKGAINNASYGGISSSKVSDLSPSGVGTNLPTSGFAINTIYNATLACSFTLIRTRSVPQKKDLVWTAAFFRTKPFPSANQLDVPGTTSPLINESEFERSLTDMARDMSMDVHEKMLDVF